jgi:hypothetical protein
MVLHTEWSLEERGRIRAPCPLPATKSPGSAGASTGANANRPQGSERVEVEVGGLTAHYKGVAVLSSINLTIVEGEFFSLFGTLQLRQSADIQYHRRLRGTLERGCPYPGSLGSSDSRPSPVSLIIATIALLFYDNLLLRRR